MNENKPAHLVVLVDLLRPDVVLGRLLRHVDERQRGIRVLSEGPFLDAQQVVALLQQVPYPLDWKYLVSGVQATLLGYSESQFLW